MPNKRTASALNECPWEQKGKHFSACFVTRILPWQTQTRTGQEIYSYWCKNYNVVLATPNQQYIKQQHSPTKLGSSSSARREWQEKTGHCTCPLILGPDLGVPIQHTSPSWGAQARCATAVLTLPTVTHLDSRCWDGRALRGECPTRDHSLPHTGLSMKEKWACAR